MHPRKKLLICLIANALLLTLVVLLSYFFAGASDYWRIGWQDNLVIVSVTINTMWRYIVLLIVVAILNWGRVLIEELGMPVLGFSIYNPDKKVITEFTKNELQFYANAMFIVTGIRNVFTVLLTIAQIDLAIYNVMTSEAASILTIRMLLNEKVFKTEIKEKEVDQDIELTELIISAA